MSDGLHPVTSEIRFAVVMYGGISLAIYMNGIAQELLHLVRSTARKGWRPDEEDQFRFAEDKLSGTERVYRKLAEQLTPGEGNNGVRFIVDILSGTSAGGINAIFLSKALANGQSIDSLKNLWIEQGDIEKLLNDSSSTLGENLQKPLHPKSLLSGDRMYCELLKAFTGMDVLHEQSPTGTPELVEELDLYVTTTDIRGRVIPLRTSDRLVYERRYKYAFHFAYSRPESEAAGRNDFTLTDNPFLSFAARCTSSFPFAFEPMTLGKVEELLPSFGGYRYPLNQDWQRFFSASQMTEDVERCGIKDRCFGDGGYLDNKPFGYAIETLGKRSSDLPTKRKLLYIEPAPEHPELESNKAQQAERTPPNALENSVAALVTLPGYEPIREDLLRVNERNRVIRKVTELIDVIAGLRHSRPVSPSEEQAYASVTELQTRRGAAYASYMLLRVFDVTDDLADVVAKALDIERESSYFYAIRCIVRAWREMYYERSELLGPRATPFPIAPTGEPDAPSGTTLRAFLDDFDLGYPIRRLRFVTTQVDGLYSFDDRAKRRLNSMGLLTDQGNAGQWEADGLQFFRAGLREIKAPIDLQFQKLRDTARDLHKNAMLQGMLKSLSKAVLDNVLGVDAPTDPQRGSYAPRLQGATDDTEYVEHARKLLSETTNPKGARALVSMLNGIANVIRKQVQTAVGAAAENGDIGVDLLATFRNRTASGDAGRAYRAVLQFYDAFSEYDAAIFPVIYGTDIGELDWVDVIRVSPEDATAIVDELRDGVRKLKGTWLGHFGAFLDARWRANDILWGRLDAAERLIRSLLPGPEGIGLVKAAHDAILEELVHETLIDSGQEVLGMAMARTSKQAGGSD
jgi:patatin-related protein